MPKFKITPGTKFKLVPALMLVNSNSYLNRTKYKGRVLEQVIVSCIITLNRIIWVLALQIQLLRQPL